jgi:hypothetical protein
MGPEGISLLLMQFLVSGSTTSSPLQQCGTGTGAIRSGVQQFSALSIDPMQHCPAKSLEVAALVPG